MNADFLTLAALSRKLDLPQTRMRALLTSGVIEPDGRAGRSILFHPARIKEIRAAVRSSKSPRRGALPGVVS